MSARKWRLKMETKESTTPAQSGNPGLLHADEIIVSVLETDADSVRIKLWPDAAAVRSRLSVLEMAMGADTYSIRRYVCGRALYCAVALDDATRDAPCPAGYQVNADANLNEADGSLVAAAAEWGIGYGVFSLPPLRISKDRVQINPVAGRDGKTIHHYVLADRLTVAGIGYDTDGDVTEIKLRKASDGSVITWQAN